MDDRDSNPSMIHPPEAETPGGGRHPDLEIRIRSSGGALPVLEFWLSDAQAGLVREDCGAVQLRREPQAYFDHFFRKIKGSVLQGQGAAEHLAKKGAQLAGLLPEDLLRHLWQRRDEAASLWIQSQEVWIPWELLKLEGQGEEGRWAEGPFLCEAFALTRWQEEISPKLDLPLNHLGVVAPGASNLATTSEEVDFLLARASPERRVRKIPARRREILAAWAEGDLDGLHFSGHGITPPGDPDDWAIMLEDGDPLTPARLYGEARNLGLSQPLVFLNACHTGRGAMSLSHLGGWASKLLDVGAGAFLGTSWPVKDRAALRFAVHFYQGFLDGLPIGEAVRRARLEIRREFPGDASWLAYTVFAHPLACCQPQPTADPNAEMPLERISLKDRWRWKAVGLMIGLLTAGMLSMLRAPTRVQLDLIVDRIAFTVAGDGPQTLLSAPLRWQRLTVSGFDRLELAESTAAESTAAGSTAGKSMAAEPTATASTAAASIAAVQIPEQQRSRQVTITAHSPEARVDLRMVDDEPDRTSFGTLEPLTVPPRIEIELHSRRTVDGSVELGLWSWVDQLQVTTSDAFELQARSTDFIGPGDRPTGSGASVQGPSSIEIFRAQDRLELSVQAQVSPVLALLEGDLAIAAIRFEQEGSDGQARSALRGDGQLTYPGRDLAPIALQPDDFLTLADLHDFILRDLRLDGATGRQRLLLEGRAGVVRHGSARGLLQERTLPWVQGLPGPTWVGWISWLSVCVMVAHGLEKIWRARDDDGE